MSDDRRGTDGTGGVSNRPLPGDSVDRRDESDTTGTDYGTGGDIGGSAEYGTGGDAGDATGYDAGTLRPGTTTMDDREAGSARPGVDYHSDRPLSPGDSEYGADPP